MALLVTNIFILFISTSNCYYYSWPINKLQSLLFDKYSCTPVVNDFAGFLQGVFIWSERDRLKAMDLLIRKPPSSYPFFDGEIKLISAIRKHQVYVVYKKIFF